MCCAHATACVSSTQHSSEEQSMTQILDTSLHERRRAERMRDPEFRAAYEQAAGEIAQTDHIIRTLDELRAEMGISKAELARRIECPQAVYRASGAAGASANHRGRRGARLADRDRSRVAGGEEGGSGSPRQSQGADRGLSGPCA